MTNKIVARKLLYDELLLRYGNLECKVEKDNEKDILMLVYGNRVFNAYDSKTSISFFY